MADFAAGTSAAADVASGSGTVSPRAAPDTQPPAGPPPADVASGSGTATPRAASPPPAASGGSSVARVARSFTGIPDLKRKMEEGAARQDALTEDVERLKRQKTDAAAEIARIASELESLRSLEQVELAARFAGVREKKAQLAAQVADLDRQEAELAAQLEPSRQQEAELERARARERDVATRLEEAEKNREAEVVAMREDTAAVVKKQMRAMLADVTGLFSL